jgi:hypothetical protein
MKLPENVSKQNDFDQFLILNDMLSQNEITKNKNENLKKMTSCFKNYTKKLTAHLNQASECDGNNDWKEVIISNKDDLFNKEIKCIGTSPADFELGDPITIDIQPLSTTLDIMCKLVVISQEANKQRTQIQPEPEPEPPIIITNKLIPEPIKVEKLPEVNKRLSMCQLHVERISDEQTSGKEDDFVDTFVYNHEVTNTDNTSIKTSFISKKVNSKQDNNNSKDSLKQYIKYRVEKKTNRSEQQNKRASVATCTNDDENSSGWIKQSKYRLVASKSDRTLLNSIDNNNNNNKNEADDLMTCLPISIQLINKCSKNNNNATSNKLVDIHIPITKLNLKRSYEWNTNPQEIRSYVNPLYFSKNISSSMFSTTTTTTDNITSTKVTTIITNQK